MDGRAAADALPALLEAEIRRRVPAPEARVQNWRAADHGYSTETHLFEVVGVPGRARPWALVFRRPPEVALFPDYDLLRQVRVMQTLAGTSVRVPEVFWLDREGGPFGSPYVVMEQVASIGTTTDIPSPHTTGIYADTDDDGRRRMWDALIGTLATVHGLDWRRLGLGWLTSAPAGGNPLEPVVGYLERTLPWAHAELGETLPEALRFLRRELYRPARISLCWGDARMSNLLFTPDLGVAAVLDWEISFLGDPEADLAWTLFMAWAASDHQGVVPLPGTPGREEIVLRYQDLTGHVVENLRYNEVLAATLLSVPLLRLATRFGLEDPSDLTAFCVTRLRALL